MKCLSRMTGNYHVRFLEGRTSAMGSGYSILFPSIKNIIISSEVVLSARRGLKRQFAIHGQNKTACWLRSWLHAEGRQLIGVFQAQLMRRCPISESDADPSWREIIFRQTPKR